MVRKTPVKKYFKISLSFVAHSIQCAPHFNKGTRNPTDWQLQITEEVYYISGKCKHQKL